MCIDDKNLGEYGFTIMSNLDTGKIAFMIQTRKSEIINEALKKNVPENIRLGVKILTKDLAPNYEAVRESSFPHAAGVADKFHVVKLGIQSINDLRVFYRQEEMTKERLRKEAHKCNEARNRDLAERRGEKYITKKPAPPQRMRNGETLLQVLALTNRALSQFQVKWGKEMKERVKILFENLISYIL
jgi:transposase